MRTDAKIGFAIGGVLLAVLTVYAVVVPRHKHLAGNTANVPTLTTASGTAPIAPPVPAVETPVEPPTVVAEKSPVTPVMPAAPAGASGDAGSTEASAKPANVDRPIAAVARSSDPVNWEKLLGGDPNAPALMTTTTPDRDGKSPEALETPTGQAAGGGINTPGATPRDAFTASATTEVHTSSAAIPTSVSLLHPATQPAGAGKSYVIKSGQTLSTIAAEVYGNQRFYVAIIRANPTVNPNRLRPGTRIVLPELAEVKPPVGDALEKSGSPSHAVAVHESKAAAGGGVSEKAVGGKSYKVEAGDNLYRIAKKLYGSGRRAEAIYALNEDAIGPDKSKLKLGMILKLPIAPTVEAAVSR